MLRARRRRRAARRELVDGHRLAGRLHDPGRRGVVARAGQARAAPRRAGHQGRRRRGLVHPRRRALRRRHIRRAVAPGATGCSTAARCSARSTRCIPARACCSGARAGRASRPSGITWGGDQPSDFWSLRTLVAATLTAAASGFSNWSHDIGGYLGERLVARCPKELLLRWVQFGCFTPLMHAHGRFEQEAWTYDEETLRLYRDYVAAARAARPYVRAAAATAARCGLPIVRPLRADRPSRRARLGGRRRLRLRPVAVGRAGAGGRRARGRGRPARAATGSTCWTARRSPAAASRARAAPLDRIPVWVRRGAIDRHLPGRRTSRAASATRRARAPARGDAVGRAAGRPCRRPARRRHGDPLHARRVVGQRRPRRGRSELPRDDAGSPRRARRRRTRCAPPCPRTCAWSASVRFE